MQGRAEVRARVVGPRGARAERVSLAGEAEVAILLRGGVVARLAASPVALDELAVGHLALRGLLASRDDVRGVRVRRWRDGWRVAVDARLRARRRRAARGAARVAQVRASRAELLGLMRDLHGAAAMYRAGGGVHTSALAGLGPPRIVLVAADIGKVNTLDRLAGQLLLAGEPAMPIVLTTGRITGAMAERALALGCRVIVSHSGPTTRAVSLARHAGATLVGYARGGACTVYTRPRRVRA